jgi:hypothetical protein
MAQIRESLLTNLGAEIDPKPKPKPQPTDAGVADKSCVVGAQLC